MHLHYLTLQRQVDFLREHIIGCRVSDSFTQAKNEWVMVLESSSAQTRWLQFSTHGKYPYILLNDASRRAAASTGVMSEVVDRIIRGITLFPADRVIRIDFESTPFHLLCQLFTNHTNFFFLTDEDDVIINSFKNARTEKGRGYRLETHPLPDIGSLDEQSLRERLQQLPEAPLGKTLRQFRYMARPVITEILCRCGLSSETPVGEVEQDQLKRIAEESLKFFEACRTENPRVYLENNLPVKFTLCPFQSLAEKQVRVFPDINAGLRYFNFHVLKSETLLGKKSRYLHLVEKQLQKIEHTIRQLSRGSMDSGKESYYQRIGELLISQPDAAKPGSTEVQLTDYFDETLPVIRVKIDPKKSARENAEAYFQKARQFAQRIDQYRERVEQLQQNQTILRDIQAQLSSDISFKQLQRIEKTLKQLHILQAPREERSEFRLPYKRYEFKGYEIWVGKSARDNDLLTFKHAHKEDFWLHAQNYSGSHVVVRNPQRREQLPGEVIEYAARLAVTHSAGKHAAYVPVLVTRVKYLRKPRKAPPGTVIPTRSKTIFVDPL